MLKRAEVYPHQDHPNGGKMECTYELYASKQAFLDGKSSLREGQAIVSDIPPGLLKALKAHAVKCLKTGQTHNQRDPKEEPMFKNAKVDPDA